MTGSPFIGAIVGAQLVLFGLGAAGLGAWYYRDRKKPYRANEAAAKAARNARGERVAQACMLRQLQVTFVLIACIAMTVCMAALRYYPEAHIIVFSSILAAVWSIASLVAEYYQAGEELVYLQTAACILPMLHPHPIMVGLSTIARALYVHTAYHNRKPETDLEMLKFDAAIQLLIVAADAVRNSAAFFFAANILYFGLLPIAVMAMQWMRTTQMPVPRNWGRNNVLLVGGVAIGCVVLIALSINRTSYYPPCVSCKEIAEYNAFRKKLCADPTVDMGVVGCGIGECYREFSRCIDGRYNTECLANYPRPEKCDCLDNDCNGVVDDGAVCDGYETDCTMCGLGESERFLIVKKSN